MIGKFVAVRAHGYEEAGRVEHVSIVNSGFWLLLSLDDGELIMKDHRSVNLITAARAKQLSRNRARRKR